MPNLQNFKIDHESAAITEKLLSFNQFVQLMEQREASLISDGEFLTKLDRLRQFAYDSYCEDRRAARAAM
jgi:hypothetical protein